MPEVEPRAQVFNRGRVHPTVLPHFQLGQVETEGLDLPDEMLHLTVGDPLRSCLRQGLLQQPKVGEELIRCGIGEVGEDENLVLAGEVDEVLVEIGRGDDRCRVRGIADDDRDRLRDRVEERPLERLEELRIRIGGNGRVRGCRNRVLRHQR